MLSYLLSFVYDPYAVPNPPIIERELQEILKPPPLLKHQYLITPIMLQKQKEKLIHRKSPEAVLRSERRARGRIRRRLNKKQIE